MLKLVWVRFAIRFVRSGVNIGLRILSNSQVILCNALPVMNSGEARLVWLNWGIVVPSSRVRFPGFAPFFILLNYRGFNMKTTLYQLHLTGRLKHMIIEVKDNVIITLPLTSIIICFSLPVKCNWYNVVFMLKPL